MDRARKPLRPDRGNVPLKDLHRQFERRLDDPPARAFNRES